MAVELASGYVSVVPTAKRFGSALDKQIGPDVDKAARSAGGRAGTGFAEGFKVPLAGLAAAAAAAFATIQIGGLIKGSITAASDLSESISKVNVVFGDSADEIQSWAKTAATSLGQSNQQALEAAGTFGNLFKAMGIGTDTAADMSTKMVELAADLASFNNANPEDVLLALRSGLVGETEPLRQFGVNLNDARIKAEALRLGLVNAAVDQSKLSAANEAAEKAARAVAKAQKEHGESSQEFADATRDAEQANSKLADVMGGKVPAQLDAATKAQAAYSLILADTTLAQGDFARTSGGLANQMRILKAQMADGKAALGQIFLPAAVKVVTFLNQKAIPGLRKFGDSFGKLLSPAIRDFRAELDGVGKPVEGVAAKVGDAVGRIINTIKLIPEAFTNAFKGEGVTSGGFIGVVEQIAVEARKLVTFFREDVPAAVKVFMDAFNGAEPDDQKGVLGLVSRIGSAVGTVNDLIKENPDIKDFVKDLGLLVGALVALNQIPGGSKIIGTITSDLLSIGPALASNPFGVALLGLGALVGAFVLADKKIKPFSESVDEVQKTFSEEGFGAAVKEAADQFDKLWDLVRPKLVRFVAEAEQWFKDHVADLFNFQVFDPRTLEAGVAPPDIMQQLEIPPGAAPPPPPPKMFKSFGDGFADAMLNQVVPAIGNWFTTNRQAVFDAINKLLDVINEWIQTTGIPFLREQGPKLALALVEGFGEFEFKNILSEALGLGGIAVALGQLPEAMFDKFDEVLGPGGKLDQLVGTFLGGLNQSILDGLDGIGRFAVDTLDAIGRFTVEAGTEIGTAIGGLLLQLLTLPEAFFDAADGIWDGMWDGIYTAFKAALNLVIRAWNSIPSFEVPKIHVPGTNIDFGGFSVGVGKIQELARGGFVTSPTLALIGEAGPEVVAPQRMLSQIMRAELASVGGGGRSVSFGGVTINEANDPNKTLAVLDGWARWKLTGRGER